MGTGVTYTIPFAASALARVLLSGVLLLCVMPALVFGSSRRWTIADRAFAGMIRSALAIIISVYLLVALKIYELPSLAAVFLALAGLRIARLPTRALRGRLDATAAAFLDVVDGRRDDRVLGPWRATSQALRRPAPRLWRTVITGGTVAVLVAAGFLRLYDPFIHAAPALSDAYVTLAWMKYMESKQLYHDGIYPHGFHIILSALRKISAIDPVLVLKFAGPLASLLTVAGAWYCATRLTKSPTAGLVAAFVLGLLPRALPLDYARQASTNSQEFGMAFVLPVVVFLSRYLDEGDRLDLTTAGAGLAVTGLVHPLPALAAAAYTGCCLGAHAICGSLDRRRARRVIWAGLLAASLSVAPIVAGLLCGIPIHQSSLAFALSGENAVGQRMTPVALAGVCCAAGGMVIALFRHARGGSRWDTGVRQVGPLKDALVCLLLTLTSLALWQAPRLGLSSLVLSTRGGESGSLGIALGISAGVGSLSPDSPARRGAGRLVAALVLLGLGVLAWKAGVQPAGAYRMQSDAWVDQYLRIATTTPPHEWMIVGGAEGYALALGVGWHMSLQDFLATYDPAAMPPSRKGDQPDAPVLPVARVFLFLEKNVFRPSPGAPGSSLPAFEAGIERAGELAARLDAWIRAYAERHRNISLYFSDHDLEVWLIDQGAPLQGDWQRVWRPEGPGSGDGR